MILGADGPDTTSWIRHDRIYEGSDKSGPDLFVLQDGKVGGQSADGDSEESVTIANPKGTYMILIDWYSVPAGTTAYDYLDVVANTKHGTVVVTGLPALYEGSLIWSAPGVVTTKAARQLLSSCSPTSLSGAETSRLGPADTDSL